MTVVSRVEELRARLQLTRDSATLVLVVVESDGVVPRAAQILLELLRAAPMDVCDLGACSNDAGPTRWADQIRERKEHAFVLTYVPTSQLAARSFASRLNAERELLRRLRGPVVLVISNTTDKMLRQHAPDFATWVAQTYELAGPDALQEAAGQMGVAPERVALVTPPEQPIRFLHLSDFHLRPQRVKRYDQDRVLEGLLRLLERDRTDFPLDLIFITGDLAHSGKAEEYALVVEFLRRLMELTRVPAQRVFVVPGNHDVDREVGKWLLRTLAGDEDAIAFFEGEKGRAFHEQKLAAFRDGLRPLLGETRSLGLGVGARAVETVDIRGARLAIAAFNSAWFAQGDDDQGKLWLGEPNVRGAVDHIADEEAGFAVALLHHPFSDLHEVERDMIESWFERSFDLVLRGHLHSNKTRSIVSPRGGFVEVVGPAAYQGSKWPNGCFFGEIRPRAGTVKLRPYHYTAGPDPWVLDTGVFPDDEKTGYCRMFIVPPKSRQRSVIARPLRAAAEAAVRGAWPVQRAELDERLAPMASSALKAARAMGESPEIWSEIADSRMPLTAKMRAVLAARAPMAPTELRDVQAFVEVLSEAGRLYRQIATTRGTPKRISENDAVFALAAAIGSRLTRAVVVGPAFEGASTPVRPDIVIVRPGAAFRGEVIEVVRARQRGAMRPRTETLAQLDKYIELANSEFAALVTLDALPAEARSPEVDEIVTPSGRRVVLMYL